MSTAAHCPDNFEEKATGLKYSFVKEIPYTQGNDLQWNSTTATITNQFRDSPTTFRTLTGKGYSNQQMLVILCVIMVTVLVIVVVRFR